MLVNIRVKHVVGDEVQCVCASSICEAPYNALFLLDDVVDLHPSTARFLGDRADVYSASIPLIISNFPKKGSTFHVLLMQVHVASGAGHFTGTLYGCLSMYV